MLHSLLRRALAAVACALAFTVLPAAGALAAPPTANDFARAPAISNVDISPNGKQIVALTSPDGVNLNISVWNTATPTAAPYVIGSGRMRFSGVSFLKNDMLLVRAIQPFTSGNDKTHVRITRIYDLRTNTFATLLPTTNARSEDEQSFQQRGRGALIDSLPQDPQSVIVEDTGLSGRGDIYKVNFYTGANQRIDHASDKFGDNLVDLKGQIRAKSEVNFDGGKVYIAQWIKHPDTGAWEEHFRSYAKDRVITEVVGFSTDPNIIYVSTARDGDKTGIYEYDIRARKILEPLFSHKMFDATGVIQAVDGRVLGFTYDADTTRYYWTDETMAAMATALDTALGITKVALNWTDPGSGQTARISIPNGASANISAWSDDLKSAIVVKNGPNQPSEYYLLSGGKLSLLGKARPWINTATLGQARMVEYAARDGLMIPAFLFTPPADVYGPGPYPTIIEPHGGPWARDNLTWDTTGWTQYFASHGYAVLQPQFRGSEGWGQRLWRAGDGQWGQAMQDDKDDAVKWLIAQKIAAPGRVAMFGYSYGGYAALTAAIRPNGLYACAISGAGAGDLATLKRLTRESRWGREFQNPTVAGLDALDHAREAQIPLFIYHGDHDVVVDIEQSKKFVSALNSAGRPNRFLQINDMGHTIDTWLPAMAEEQLVEIEKYLKTDCKPGGL